MKDIIIEMYWSKSERKVKDNYYTIWLWSAIGHLQIRRFDFFFFIRAMIKGTWLDAVFRADYESDLKNKLKLNFHSESSTLQHFQLLSLLFRLSNPLKKFWKLSYPIENRILYNMAYFFSCFNEKSFFYILKKCFGPYFACNFVLI
jgi:hypothetical protein